MAYLIKHVRLKFFEVIPVLLLFFISLNGSSVIDFTIPREEKQRLASVMMARLMDILTQEGVTYEMDVLSELMIKYLPDWRRVINELQRYGTSGMIDSSILLHLDDSDVIKLMDYLKKKDFSAMRKWVVNNLDADPVTVFRKIYDHMNSHVDPKSIPQLVLILADYQYKDSFVADHELNLVACLTEVMAGVNFNE